MWPQVEYITTMDEYEMNKIVLEKLDHVPDFAFIKTDTYHLSLSSDTKIWQ